MYPNALIMLAMDERDASLLDGIVAAAGGLGIQSVRLVHVSATDPLPKGLLAGIDLPDPPPPAGLQQAVHTLQAALPGVEVTGEFAVGAPAEVLAQLIETHDVDLMVLGRSKAATDDTPAWGPHGRHLLRTVSCSVLMVPQGASLSLDEVVVGLDFSSNAGEALRVATAVAGSVRAVCQYDAAVSGSGAITEAEFEQALRENAEKHFERDLLPLIGDAPRPALEIAAGPRASAVLIEKAGDGLLIVGSRGLSRVATLLLGSTAENLAGRARGPLLIVRKKGEVMGFFEGLVHR